MLNVEMKTFLYIQYKKNFKCDTPKEAAKKAANYYFLLKPMKKSINVSIKDIKNIKIYYYNAYKNTNNNIIVKRKIKKIAGNFFKDGDEVTLYDTKNKGYITAYEQNEILDPYERFVDGRIKGRKYKLSDIVTSNSIFILIRKYSEPFKKNFTFQLKKYNNKYKNFGINNCTYLLTNSEYAQWEINDSNIINITECTNIHKIQVNLYIPNMVKYLRNRETGIKR